MSVARGCGRLFSPETPREDLAAVQRLRGPRRALALTALCCCWGLPDRAAGQRATPATGTDARPVLRLEVSQAGQHSPDSETALMLFVETRSRLRGPVSGSVTVSQPANLDSVRLGHGSDTMSFGFTLQPTRDGVPARARVGTYEIGATPDSKPGTLIYVVSLDPSCAFDEEGPLRLFASR